MAPGHLSLYRGSDESRARQDDAVFDEILHPDLRAAARATWAALVREAAAEAAAEEELVGSDSGRLAAPTPSEVVAVARAVEDGAALTRVEGEGETTGFHTRARRLEVLERIQRNLVEAWAAEAAAPPELRLLAAAERVRSALAGDATLARMASEAESLNLVRELAHDFRSPLTAIMLLAETMLRGQSGQVTGVQRQQLGLVYSAALSLLATATDVMELPEDGSALLDPEPVPFSLQQILEAVRDFVQPLAEIKNLSLRLAHSATDRRSGYRMALKRVLLNLVTNALNYTEEGYVELACKASGAQRVEFWVRDTGPGIDPAMLAGLRRPRSVRGAVTPGDLRGPGLGLGICRKLVSSMGSELLVETASGRGTRFSFTLELPPVSSL